MKNIYTEFTIFNTGYISQGEEQDTRISGCLRQGSEGYYSFTITHKTENGRVNRTNLINYESKEEAFQAMMDTITEETLKELEWDTQTVRGKDDKEIV